MGLDFNIPAEIIESRIVRTESGVNEKEALKLVRLANKVRQLRDLGLTETVSTRLLVDAAKLINSGIGPRKACRVAIISPLTDDPEIHLALNEYVALVF